MNLLYIGPYRQNNTNGWTSTALLQQLLSSNKYNITCRPIYLESSDIVYNIDPNITHAETNTLSNYDIIIQHAHADALIRINTIPKNIAIPIINNENLDNGAIENLQHFDTILVDSKIAYHKYRQYKSLQNKIKTYDYSINTAIKSQSIFRIGILERSNKLYFIGSYNTNINNIMNVCRAFIRNITMQEYSLLLFLFDMDQNKIKQLESNIKQYYDSCQIHYMINRILVMPIETKLENVLVAHQTGDIYIDLQDDNSNSLNVKLAASMKKDIIQFDFDDMVMSFNRNNKLFKHGCEGVSEHAINKHIGRCLLGDNFTIQPFKKENILNLI